MQDHHQRQDEQPADQEGVANASALACKHALLDEVGGVEDSQEEHHARRNQCEHRALNRVAHAHQGRNDEQKRQHEIWNDEGLFMLPVTLGPRRLVMLGSEPPDPEDDNSKCGRQLKPDQYKVNCMEVHR